MGDCGSKKTVDNSAQTTVVESEIQNDEELMMPPVFPIRPISDKPEPNSLYPPVSQIDDSSKIVYCRLSSYSKDEECSKICPSGGYNFSQNATFEASKTDNIAANTVTTNITDSEPKINNN